MEDKILELERRIKVFEDEKQEEHEMTLASIEAQFGKGIRDIYESNNNNILP